MDGIDAYGGGGGSQFLIICHLLEETVIPALAEQRKRVVG